MASAELLKMTHSVDTKVTGVDDRVKVVDTKITGVDDRVKAVDDKLQDVGKDVRGDVQDVGDKVQSVDDKLDQVNRSFFLTPALVPSTQTASQGINLGIVFYDGFRPQIHPSITTLHAKLITTVQLNGSFRAVCSVSGNPPTPSYGYTENVRYSSPSSCNDL